MIRRHTFQLERIMGFLDLDIVHIVRLLKNERSKLLILHPEKHCIIDKACCLLLMIVLACKKKDNMKESIILSIAEFLGKSRKITSSDKWNWQDANSLIIPLLATLAQGLIARERVVLPFWNNKCQETSNSLAYFTQRDSPGLVSNSLNQSLNCLGVKSSSSVMKNNDLQSKSSRKIFLQSFLSAATQTAAKAEKTLRTRKVKLYPGSEQKVLLQQWFDGARWTYNESVAYIQIEGLQSWMTLRNKLVTATRYYCPSCNEFVGRSKSGRCDKEKISQVQNADGTKKAKTSGNCGTSLIVQTNDALNDELAKVPKHIRLAACKSVVTAYKGAITKIKRGSIAGFKIGFKNKKDLISDTIEVEKRSIHFNPESYSYTIYSTTFSTFKKTLRRKTKKNVPPSIDGDAKIQYNYKSKEYFLLIPIETSPFLKDQNANSKIVSVDPGVKTFLTLYDSENGAMIQFSKRAELLKRLQRRIASIQAAKKKVPYKHHSRINNIINDFQWRVCDEIQKEIDPAAILLPKFESQKLKMKNRRHYNRILLNTDRHYQFKQKLNWKGYRYGFSVLEVTEEYTSKTCGLCGTINHSLSLSDRLFSCTSASCEYQQVDRDYNGARNILLKTLCS